MLEEHWFSYHLKIVYAAFMEVYNHYVIEQKCYPGEFTALFYVSVICL